LTFSEKKLLIFPQKQSSLFREFVVSCFNCSCLCNTSFI